MKVLFDTDVILDLLLDREPHSQFAALLIAEVERGAVTGYLCATSITTIHYLAGKGVGASDAERSIRDLLSLFEIATVNRAVLEGALEAGFRDFEDAVSHEAALRAGAEAIVTRNLGDYRKSSLPVYSPRDCLALLMRQNDDEEEARGI
jgi:predicted nucleic acid-binding protein